MSASPNPNILWLLTDEHSFRHVSHRDPAAGGEPVHTPAIDALDRSGSTFDQAYCPVPVCTPSRLCMLTGRTAPRCGAWTNSAMLRPNQETLPGCLSRAGYDTSLIGKMHLGGDRQFAGFDHRPYGDLTGYHGHQGEPIPDRAAGLADDPSRIRDAGVTGVPESILQEYRVLRETVSIVRERAHRTTDQPWFVCASFSRPHFPLTAPRRHVQRYWDIESDTPTDRFAEPMITKEDAFDHPVVRTDRDERFGYDEFDRHELMRARACYFACVDFIDEVIGELLATLDRDGLLENTIVVYTSDHGELADEHGLWWKSVWHEASTRVPFIVQTPDQRADEAPPRSIRTPVSTIDLFPTLCGLVGVDPPDGLDGVDLSPAVRTGAEPDRGPVSCDILSPMWGPGTEYRMVREGDYKYVAFRDEQIPNVLFNVEEDPFETTNLVPGASGADADAKTRLAALVDEQVDFDALASDRAADLQRRDDNTLPVDSSFRPNRGGLNAYHLPNGQIVETEGTLYRPRVIADDPASIYADWPHRDEPTGP